MTPTPDGLPPSSPGWRCSRPQPCAWRRGRTASAADKSNPQKAESASSRLRAGRPVRGRHPFGFPTCGSTRPARRSGQSSRKACRTPPRRLRGRGRRPGRDRSCDHVRADAGAGRRRTRTRGAANRRHDAQALRPKGGPGGGGAGREREEGQGPLVLSQPTRAVVGLSGRPYLSWWSQPDRLEALLEGNGRQGANGRWRRC